MLQLTSMCDAIAGFLDYSSSLVEKEGKSQDQNTLIKRSAMPIILLHFTAKVISDAVASLLAKLPEEEKAKMDKVQISNQMKEKLQEKIAVIVKPAFSG